MTLLAPSPLGPRLPLGKCRGQDRAKSIVALPYATIPDVPLAPIIDMTDLTLVLSRELEREVVVGKWDRSTIVVLIDELRPDRDHRHRIPPLRLISFSRIDSTVLTMIVSSSGGLQRKFQPSRSASVVCGSTPLRSR